MLASINENQPDERSYEESVTLANNEQSSTISKFNQMESLSTPVNTFVAAGIIPSHILELFAIPTANEQTQTIPRALT